MHAILETHYAPVLDPRDPQSAPPPTRPGDVVFTPLRPDRRGRPHGESWLARAAGAHALVGHTCIADGSLRRLERRDPYGLRLAARAGVDALVSMDTPLYAFMTRAQVERQLAVHLHRLLRTLDLAPRHGLEAVPLLKGTEVGHVDTQLELLRELGVRRAAFYARELLLEGDARLVRRFVRGANARGVRPWLIGASSRRATQWGPALLAGQRHYVLARRGQVLHADGRARRHMVPFESAHAGPVAPGDVGALTFHNLGVMQARLRNANRRLPVEA